MAVARSFEKFKIVGEPFEENKRMYVMLENGRKVRWYTEDQRLAMDVKAGLKPLNGSFSAFKAFGFDNGYITIFKGDPKEIEEWATATSPSRARFATFLGWYVPSTEAVENLPNTIQAFRLKWDDVKADENTLKSNDLVSAYIKNLLYGPTNSVSVYQGTKDAWLERTLVVKSNSPKKSQYGEMNIHILEDEAGNRYVWATGTKNYPIDFKVKLKMKVKEHKEIDGAQTTVVWYCKEMKS